MTIVQISSSRQKENSRFKQDTIAQDLILFFFPFWLIRNKQIEPEQISIFLFTHTTIKILFLLQLRVFVLFILFQCSGMPSAVV